MGAGDQALEEDYDTDRLTLSEIGWWTLTLLFGIVGALGGACVGWLQAMGEGGMEVIIGASIGFAVFFIIGFFIGPAKGIADKQYAMMKPPDLNRHMKLHVNPTAEIPLMVTVHKTRNISSTEGLMAIFGKKNDQFVEIKCGRKVSPTAPFFPGGNPPKRTCVSTGGVFEETFLFTVGAKDDTLVIGLYDQDVVGDDFVGEAVLNITNDILEGGFPQQQGFKLIREEGMINTTKKKTGTIVVSFAPGEGFPEASLDAIKKRHPIEYRRFENEQKKKEQEALKAYGKTSYGSLMQQTFSAKAVAPPTNGGGGGTGSATHLASNPFLLTKGAEAA